MASKEAPSELIRAKDISGFDRWSLPSFDEEGEAGAQALAEAPGEQEVEAPEAEANAQTESQDIALEDVKPLTLDELEAIRQDAYNEGFSTGEKDGFHAGQLKAKQEADTALSAKLAALERLMSHLFEPIAEQDQQMETALVDLVSHMARQVIRRELSTDSSQIRQVLREALKMLPMGANNVRIHLNPQDFEMVKALRERHEESWRILEDDALMAGGCRVETEHSRIDASIETRLSLVLKQLFDHQREQAAHGPAADLLVELDAAQESPDAP